MDEPSDRAPVEDTLVTAGASTSPRGEEHPLLRRGATIDRYVVLDHLGSGGMGVVYVAYDPDLDRKLAVKLLRPSARDPAGFARGRARLLREAQALAKLSHPNVVAVHDVGTSGEEVFVAMELVAGVTLRKWCRERPRAWHEVLVVLQQAGEGLAAAHAAGLVHRDFKPDNVMLDAEPATQTRVRVLDFGLARLTADAAASQRGGASSSSSSLELEVTSAGAMPGTPAYMAPEQHGGAVADVRSDQFAFCVTAWEALLGERPFAGATAAEVAAAMSRGAIAEPPHGSALPTHVRRVLERGLARDPTVRHPSMRALLDALARDPRRARRRWIAALAVAATGVAALGLVRAQRLRAEAQCEQQAAAIDASWDEAARERLRAAILDSGKAHAPDTWARVEPRIDAQVAQWRDARREACKSATIEGTRSAELDARAIACFDERAAELQAVIAPAGPDDPDAVDEAVVAVARLPRVSRCADEDALRRREEPDDVELRIAVVEQHREAAVVRVLRRSGRSAEARVRVAALRSRADALAWPPLQAEVIELAVGLMEDHDDAARERELERAFALAMTAGDDAATFAVALELSGVAGHMRAKHERAQWWLDLAEIEHGRLPPDALREAELDNARGLLAFDGGDYGSALLWMAARLEVLRRALGPDHPDVAQALLDVATAEQELGALEQASLHLDRVLEIRRSELGEEHPAVADAYNTLGGVHYAGGELELALAAFEHALAIEERGGSPRGIAEKLHNVATVLYDLRRFDESLAAHQRALALQEQALGPDHPNVGASLVGIGLVELGRDEPRLAIPLFERALTIRERALGPSHPQVGETVHNLGVAYLAIGETERALGYHRRAAEIYEQTFGPLHLAVGMTWLGVAADELALARWSDGLAHAERALGILAAPGAPPGSLARARVYTAHALAELGRDPTRVRELVTLAEPDLVAEGTGGAKELALARSLAKR